MPSRRRRTGVLCIAVLALATSPRTTLAQQKPEDSVAFAIARRPVPLSEVAAALVREARRKESQRTKAVRVDVELRDISAQARPAAEPQPAPAPAPPALRGADLAESARKLSDQIDRLLRVPQHVSRRDLQQRGIAISDDELRKSRDTALLARSAWLAVLEQLLRDPPLEQAVLGRMGERRFLAAKDELDGKLSQIPPDELAPQSEAASPGGGEEDSTPASTRKGTRRDPS